MSTKFVIKIHSKAEKLILNIIKFNRKIKDRVLWNFMKDLIFLLVKFYYKNYIIGYKNEDFKMLVS